MQVAWSAASAQETLTHKGRGARLAQMALPFSKVIFILCHLALSDIKRVECLARSLAHSKHSESSDSLIVIFSGFSGET